MPGVGVTFGNVEVFNFHIADGQVQGDDGVAALHRGELLRVVARSIIGSAVPSEAFASLLRELGRDGIADGQVQGDDGVAALH